MKLDFYCVREKKHSKGEDVIKIIVYPNGRAMAVGIHNGDENCKKELYAVIGNDKLALARKEGIKIEEGKMKIKKGCDNIFPIVEQIESKSLINVIKLDDFMWLDARGILIKVPIDIKHQSDVLKTHIEGPWKDYQEPYY